MKRKISSLHPLRRIRPRLASLIGLMLAVAQGYPSFGADLRKTEDGAAQPNSKCDKAPTAIDRLICLEPSLAALEMPRSAQPFRTIWTGLRVPLTATREPPTSAFGTTGARWRARRRRSRNQTPHPRAPGMRARLRACRASTSTGWRCCGTSSRAR